MKIYVVHVFDAAGKLHDYYVHASFEGASRQAACDVVDGRFDDADPDFIQAELARVTRSIYAEPATGRRHVRCDAWHAHVDEMQLLP